MLESADRASCSMVVSLSIPEPWDDVLGKKAPLSDHDSQVLPPGGARSVLPQVPAEQLFVKISSMLELVLALFHL